MKIIELKIPGCYLIESPKFTDERGVFVKTYHKDIFINADINLTLAEEFYSISNKDVIRGMHFQLPPFDHDKLVCCVNGSILDVFLDIRKSSKTYGQCMSVELNSITARSLFLPKGIAHGFLSLQDNSLMIYKTSTVYNPMKDAGLAWDSFGFEWPVDNPIISARDLKHPKFSDFNSPF